MKQKATSAAKFSFSYQFSLTLIIFSFTFKYMYFHNLHTYQAPTILGTYAYYTLLF